MRKADDVARPYKIKEKSILCHPRPNGSKTCCTLRLLLFKYLSPALNSLGKGNEFEREGGRVNFFLGMSNSVIQFHHYPECRVELEKGPSEGS